MDNCCEDSKGKIADCQQLIFMDENAPVTLQTDACAHASADTCIGPWRVKYK